MPSYQIQTPDGKKYKVDGPEGYTQEQAYKDLQGHLGGKTGGPTIGGDLLRGLVHGAGSSMGMQDLAPSAFGPEPEDESASRQTGEFIGGVIPPTVAGVFAPEGLALKAAFGAATGALQPAQDWQERFSNIGYGAAGAFGGSALSKLPRYTKTGLNRLAEMAAGYMSGGAHAPFGHYAGAALGHFAGRDLERMFGGKGLTDLVSWIASNPGLAAYLGVKASPYASQAGEWVGEQLSEPSE